MECRGATAVWKTRSIEITKLIARTFDLRAKRLGLFWPGLGDFDLFQPDSDSNFSTLVDFGAASFVFSDPDCPIGGFGGIFRVIKETWFWCVFFGGVGSSFFSLG